MSNAKYGSAWESSPNSFLSFPNLEPRAVILITGAAGKSGVAVCRALVARQAPVRALVHRPGQVQALRALGVAEVVVGNMLVEADVARAANGVEAVYHICPNMSPEEITIGHLCFKAAAEQHVKRLVFHSVLHPQIEDMPHHWKKLRVEEELIRTGLQYTILQPAQYMQNMLPTRDLIVSQGIYRVPYAVETRLGMVDLDDVGEAAAVVLMGPGHAGATYELAGDEVLTPREVAEILSREVGRPVRAETQPIETWEQQARTAGLGAYQVATLTKMFRYYERYGFWGNPNVLRGLLRRDPTRLAAFARRAIRPPVGG